MVQGGSTSGLTGDAEDMLQFHILRDDHEDEEREFAIAKGLLFVSLPLVDVEAAPPGVCHKLCIEQCRTCTEAQTESGTVSENATSWRGSFLERRKTNTKQVKRSSDGEE